MKRKPKKVPAVPKSPTPCASYVGFAKPHDDIDACTRCGEKKAAHKKPTGPKLKHDVSGYSNTFLRDINASTPEGRSVEAEDLYALAETLPDWFVLFDGTRLRRTPEGHPTVGQLVSPGDTVKSTFQHGRKTITTGPYVVQSVHEHEIAHGIKNWSLICKDAKETPGRRNSESYLNELVAVNGRLLHLFEANEGEVHILKIKVDATPEDSLDDLLATYVPTEPEFPYPKGAIVNYQGTNYEVAGKIGNYRQLNWPGSGSGICVDQKVWHAVRPGVCGLQNKEHCNGKDVRAVIKRPGNNAKKSARGTIHYWCAGCRELMQGGFRYPDTKKK